MTNREIDAAIAEKVMGLKIVAKDHPCGYDPECGNYDASYFVPPVGSWYTTPDYVYETEEGGYPPQKCDGIDEYSTRVAVVPHYSESISDAWMVVEKLGLTFLLHKEVYHYSDKNRVNKVEISYTADFNLGEYDSEADSAPLAICLAALKAVGQYTENVEEKQNA